MTMIIAPEKCQRSAFFGNKEQTRNDEQNPLVDFVISVGICDAAGVWLSLVEYLNGVQVAAGSNPVTPTIKNTVKPLVLRYFYFSPQNRHPDFQHSFQQISDFLFQRSCKAFC